MVVSREAITQRVKRGGTTQYRLLTYSRTYLLLTRPPTAYSRTYCLRAYCLLTRLPTAYAPTYCLTVRAYCLTGAGAKASVAALPSAVKSTLTRKYNQAP